VSLTDDFHPPAAVGRPVDPARPGMLDRLLEVVAEDFRAACATAERGWWSALHEDRPGLTADEEEDLRCHADAARHDALGRLVTGALRERLLEVRAERGAGTAVLVPPGEPVSGPGRGWRLVVEGFEPAMFVTASAFRSLRLEGESAGRVGRPVDHPADVLALLAVSPAETPTPGSVNLVPWRRLACEIADSVLNDALSRGGRARMEDSYTGRDRGIMSVPAATWLRQVQGPVGRGLESASLRLEQWSAVGHPIHVAPKAREGLRPGDVLSSFPEFAPTVPVILGAIAKSVATWECHPSVPSLVPWLAAELPDVTAAWSDRLLALGRDPDAYLPLPLHPVQVARVLPALLRALELRDGELLVDGPVLPCSPTLSVRTVVPCWPGGAPHMKLALGIRLTTVRRNLSPRSCVMGPRISALLESIIGADDALRGAIAIAPEVAGVCLDRLDPRYGGPLRDLGAILRRNPDRCVAATETPVPCSALPLVSPISGKPLFLELNHGNASPRDAFADYAARLSEPLLRLFLVHGIFLEAHPQNTFLVVGDDNAPRGILVRDLGGIRIHEPTMRAHGFGLDIHPDRLTVSDDWLVARHRLTHAVFLWHVGHLAWAVARDSGVAEARLWSDVREIISGILDAHRDEVPVERWRAERRQLLDSDWEAKAFIRMRLDDTQDERVSPLPNPLRR
jgi:siderophore synthetase component